MVRAIRRSASSPIRSRARSCGSRCGRRSRRRRSRSRSRLPAAYVLGRYRFRGRGLVGAIVVVPFVLPTVVVALAFLAILPDGLERGWAPILVAHAFFNVAVVVRIVGTFWANLDPRVGEAAATLGASPVARCARDHCCRCSRLRSPRPRRSSSSSRSPRSASSSSSAGRGTRRSRRRSTTRPSACSTSALRPCSRSFSSRAWSRPCGSRRGSSGGSRSPARCAPSATRCGLCEARRDKLVVAASLGGLALFLGLPLAVLVERSLAVGDGHWLRRVPGART